MKKELFGKLNGKDVYKYELKGGKVTAEIITYGGAIQSLVYDGVDVALGYDTVEEYASQGGNFGALIGRYGNRIANHSFALNGKTYELYDNDKTNCLHGGKNGYNKVIWDVLDYNDNSITLKYFSKDGEENFPGNLEVVVKYTVENDGLTLEYNAVCDKDTPLNLTNHNYFNLNGEGEGSIINHKITLLADKFTPVSAKLIPTGEERAVKGTYFDFTSGKTIAQDLEKADEQIGFGGGYDHNFCLNGNGYRKFAEAVGDKSGIKMTCYTDLPGVQFYIGNFMTDRCVKGGKRADKRHGFCLETQYYPNSINTPSFPNSVLKKGEKYYSKTAYVFSK